MPMPQRLPDAEVRALAVMVSRVTLANGQPSELEGLTSPLPVVDCDGASLSDSRAVPLFHEPFSGRLPAG